MGQVAAVAALIALALVSVPLLIAATMVSGPAVLAMFAVGLVLSAALKM